jgi:hypothetical protein
MQRAASRAFRIRNGIDEMVRHGSLHSKRRNSTLIEASGVPLCTSDRQGEILKMILYFQVLGWI